MRKRVPDPTLARSLIEASEKEMQFLETLPATIDAAMTIVSRMYECFHRLGEAVLVLDGKEGDHEQCIVALMSLNVQTTRPLQVLDNLRQMRHNIIYRGFQPSSADVEDVLSIKAACWQPVLEVVKKRI